MNNLSLKLTGLSVVMLMMCSSVNAETSWQDLLEFNQSPEGQVEEQPLTLESHDVGENTEQHLPPAAVFNLWIQDETFFRPKEEDRIEIQKVLEKDAKTFKLENAIEPISFSSGQEVIPDQFVNKLKQLLDTMKSRANVRVHFVGHSDNDALGITSKAKYGDNIGLSRARAETTAEFFQRVLDLPPESVSYDGVGSSQPIASNNTAAGKAKNRRVEVQIWYDEIKEYVIEKEVVVEAPKLNRIKVCRKETVCKLRYKEGNAKRARLRNLVSPLRLGEGQSEIPEDFIREIKEVLQNLRDKENVLVRFVGHTDNLPLTDRQLRIYGKHVALSKARARRVALGIADVLGLPNTAVGSDGKGETRPVASNDTEKGRSLNRRVEVEFWHDDPFQNFTAEAQACPEKAASETITLNYDPPTGPIKSIRLQQGEPIISPAYTNRLKQLMGEITDRSNVRLSFIGYTDNQRLSRRTAMVYGDDIGLSTARARKVMDTIKTQLDLSDEQVEFEGRGFVHSKDVVSTGFVQFDSSRVEVQIVYDELAILEEDEGLDITRINREAVAQTPYALNLMRISVDGEPIHDPYKNIADLQRCTDVALEDAEIQFKFDNLKLQPRLNITAWPNSVRYQDIEETEEQENKVYFKSYSNYQDYIVKSEIRIFEEEQSTRDAALIVIPVDEHGNAEWLATFDEFEGPTKKLKYLLRVYDGKNNYDETKALPLWLLENLQALDNAEPVDVDNELLVGYGETHLHRQTIPLQGGTVTVNGDNIPKDHTVWLAGRKLPVNEDGDFVNDEIFRPGLHTVEVAVLDKEGNGELFLRELELKKSDWFYVGIADVTLAKDNTTGPANIVTQDTTHYENELNTDGYLAFYVDGKFGEGWQLTASADTGEGPIDEIFSNFMEKTPDALFRRIDPDYFYPTFGDDSTVVENAPTSGKFFVKVQRQSDYALWGNFLTEYVDTDLAHIDRGLYGVNGHYESKDVTAFGEKKFIVDGFAAEPGTIGGRDEFRGTGGSLYFLRHLDIMGGSDRIRVEVRDKDSGIVLGVKQLIPALDYDIDYIQGRVLLSQPLSSTATDSLIVDNGSLSGNPVFLVVRYEYSPGFQELDDVAIGGRAHYWINDSVKIGATISSQEEEVEESTLNAIDITIRKNAGTWLKFEAAETEGAGSESLGSSDGGFNFNELDTGLTVGSKASAYRIDSNLRLTDAIEGLRGNANFYVQEREAGYSAPGQLTANDIQQFGGTLNMPLTESINLNVKADVKDQDLSLKTENADVNVSYRLNPNWEISSGVRIDTREDNSTNIAATQKQGNRTDIAVDATYNSLENWTAYGFVQGTANATGNRDENSRVGTGATVRVTDRFNVEGELSAGDTGTGARVGTDYLVSDRTNVYMSYALDNERSDTGVRARKGNMATGFRSRYSDTTSVYGEERYSHGDVPTGLTHAMGVDIAPNDRWTYGVSAEAGTLKDQQTAAETDRLALGFVLGYEHNAIKYTGAVEYRDDALENADLTETEQKTWLFKNTFRYQINPDWRFIGKLNYSDSESSEGDFYDGEFKEYIIGYGYRPIRNDRWNTLFKYTYFFNVPSSSQELVGVGATDFLQKTNIFAVDTIYDLNRRWSLGGKYAYRLGQVAQGRDNPEFFDSTASLYVVRADWHFVHRWDVLMEARLLDLPDAEDRKSGSLFGVYRHIGKNIKFGVGYNFTDFSDDLTDLDYDSKGFFINLIAKI
ncbi:MAG: flagellar motor protein MotB [endosymbiont of Galathealinum brachiosum]|uniref:Flagellar motor protein MotB n=1 Tax=endosymbiont of Galathealinum brachiosum TaxID=2200906 RepID=A0A370DAG3_9GAMM|nr:MAG: flagellar motor protein MotB [endosymbiont of Galathealinum brachiosum]